MMNQHSYLEVSQENAKALFMRHLKGDVIMLNLLKFRVEADYSQHPELTPPTAISGQQAYELYIKHTLPHLHSSGGEVIFIGQGGHYLIGPHNVLWDRVMLVRHQNVDSFMAFAKNEAYLQGMGHRVAALQDSRLLPLVTIPEMPALSSI